MASGTEATTGGRLRDRFGRHNPAPAFGVLGLGLVGAGLAVPEFETLLVAWGGTAVFLAVLLWFVTPTATVPATVAGDVHTVMAGNARRFVGSGPHRYVPDGDGVSLVVGTTDASAAVDDAAGTELTPVAVRLLAGLDGPDPDDTVETRLPMLLDSVVHDLELAEGGRYTTTDAGVELSFTGSRVATDELFDHPVVSVVAVGLARAVGSPVTVDPHVDGDRLVVACTWD